MHMYESRVNATSIVGEEAFSVKITFFDPFDPHRDIWPHHCLRVSSGLGTGHFHQVCLKSDVGKYVKKTCCQKKLCYQSNTSTCGCAGM